MLPPYGAWVTEATIWDVHCRNSDSGHNGGRAIPSIIPISDVTENAKLVTSWSRTVGLLAFPVSIMWNLYTFNHKWHAYFILLYNTKSNNPLDSLVLQNIEVIAFRRISDRGAVVAPVFVGSKL